jgi:hypothetical protein
VLRRQPLRLLCREASNWQHAATKSLPDLLHCLLLHVLGRGHVAKHCRCWEDHWKPSSPLWQHCLLLHHLLLLLLLLCDKWWACL